MINEAILEDNDLVSTLANPNAAGFKVFQPDCGDGSKGGWWIVFKAGRGTGRDLFTDFDTDGPVNTGRSLVHVI